MIETIKDWLSDITPVIGILILIIVIFVMLYIVGDWLFSSDFDKAANGTKFQVTIINIKPKLSNDSVTGVFEINVKCKSSYGNFIATSEVAKTLKIKDVIEVEKVKTDIFSYDLVYDPKLAER